MLVTSLLAGPNGKLALFGTIQDCTKPSYSEPDPLWVPLSQKATNSQLPVNWWREGDNFGWPWVGGSNLTAFANAAAWCKAHNTNGPTIQLYYPQFDDSSFNGSDAVSKYTAYLQSIAPYIAPGTYEIACNELLYNNMTSGLLAALGGQGKTGYDGLIALIKLQRQYLPGALLGLNEPGVCDNYAGTGFYAEQLLPQVYAILKANGAALDWFGNEGYWENTTTTVAQVKAAIDSIGAAIGVPIMFTEFTPVRGCGNGNYSTQQACWQAYLTMFAADPYMYGVTGPWGGIRKSSAWDADNWLWDDGNDGITTPDGTNAPITPTLQWLQQWVPENVGPASAPQPAQTNIGITTTASP